MSINTHRLSYKESLLSNMKKKTVQVLSHNEVLVGGEVTATRKGTVAWAFTNDEGEVYQEKIPNTHFDANAPYCLYSPQHVAQVMDDNFPTKQSTYCVTHDDSVTLLGPRDADENGDARQGNKHRADEVGPIFQQISHILQWDWRWPGATADLQRWKWVVLNIMSKSYCVVPHVHEHSVNNSLECTQDKLLESKQHSSMTTKTRSICHIFPWL